MVNNLMHKKALVFGGSKVHLLCVSFPKDKFHGGDGSHQSISQEEEASFSRERKQRAGASGAILLRVDWGVFCCLAKKP
jgi:hypothetical protein